MNEAKDNTKVQSSERKIKDQSNLLNLLLKVVLLLDEHLLDLSQLSDRIFGGERLRLQMGMIRGVSRGF